MPNHFLFLYTMIKKTGYTVKEATEKLEHYCAYQDRCYKEVVDKLRGMGMIPIAIDNIIAHLIANRFLNEERFSKSFARGKFQIKKWGKNRIVRELKARGISRFNIQTALKEISDSDYYETFERLCEKRTNQRTETSAVNGKKTIVDYLLHGGCESYMVYEKAADICSYSFGELGRNTSCMSS